MVGKGPLHGLVMYGVWSKVLQGSAHMLRSPKGWAFDIEDIATVEDLGVTMVHIVDTETKVQYWARLDVVRRRGFLIERGHGGQIALPLKHWCETREQAESSDLPEDRGPKQLTLFGR